MEQLWPEESLMEKSSTEGFKDSSKCLTLSKLFKSLPASNQVANDKSIDANQ